MAESKFSDIINASLQKIKEFASSETVFGEPLTFSALTGMLLILAAVFVCREK